MKRSIHLIIIILFSSSLAACTGAFSPTFVPTYTSVVIVYTTPQAPVSGTAVNTVVSASSGAIAKPETTPTPADPLAPLWVANPDDRSVLRVDPASSTVSAVIRVVGRPEEVAVGEGAVWALDRQNNQVFRIDPDAGRVSSVIPLPPGKAASIITGNGSVWVGLTGKIDLDKQTPGMEGEVVPPGIIARIDPRENRIIEQFNAQPVRQLRTNGPELWVLSGNVIETPLQIFDVINRQGMTVPFRNAPEWLPVESMAVDKNHLWLYSAAYGKIFHADPSGQIRSAIQLEERQPLGHPDLLITSSGLWALTTWGSILHIDPDTNHILHAIDMDAPFTNLIASSGAIWALSQQTAVLYRIDPHSAEITAEIPTGSRLEPTVMPSPTPRSVLWQPCPDAATSRLKVGDTAYVTKNPPLPNRVRSEPSTESEILGLIVPGGGMDILEGPTCANGWVWWKVKNADLEGWTPEGDLETYWLIPIYE